jgi:hypothetical protein
MNNYPVRIYQAITPDERARWNMLRHRLFCLGESTARALENCPTPGRPDAPHDNWDNLPTALFFGALDGQSIGIGRLMVGDGPHGLQSLGAAGKYGRRQPADPRYNAEASRIALHKDWQKTSAGTAVLQGLLGVHIYTAAVHGRGYPLAYFTARVGMLVTLMRLLPIEFGVEEPFDYGQESTGPQTQSEDGSDPTWVVTGDYHEFGAAVHWFQPETVQAQMFPRGFGWVDWSRVRPRVELERIMADNPRHYARQMADWRAAHPAADQISVAG